jgi:hypothetical protein
MAVPIDELATWKPEERTVFVVENELNGLCFPARHDSLVVFGLGYGVSLLERLPWLATKETYYWGDIDTHGLAMLDRARAVLPGLRSFLMDQTTLLAHRLSWVREPRPHEGALARLTLEERALYDDLSSGTHGDSIRLEQERVGFEWLERALAELEAKKGEVRKTASAP